MPGSGATYDSAYRAAKGSVSPTRATSSAPSSAAPAPKGCFYYADEPKPAPEFFIRPTGRRAPWCASIPARCSSRRSRRAARSASRPVACEHRPARASSAAGCTSITATSRSPRPSSSGSVIRRPPHRLPGNRRDLHGQPGRGPPPACIARRDQPGRRYGAPVSGLHFYHGDEPKPAPEFFKPAKVKGGKSPAAIAAAAKKAAAGNSAPGTDYREHGIQRDRRAVQ